MPLKLFLSPLSLSLFADTSVSDPVFFGVVLGEFFEQRIRVVFGVGECVGVMDAVRVVGIVSLKDPHADAHPHKHAVWNTQRNTHALRVPTAVSTDADGVHVLVIGGVSVAVAVGDQRAW